jgi:hypothetical protein
VAAGTRFTFPLGRGYDYITDLKRWPEYWPNLLRVAPESRWSQPGDTARLTLKVLGRPTQLEMTLARVVPYRLVEYTTAQGGLPAARHERHFAEEPGGFAYRIAVEFEPRAGARRPFDRLLVPRAVGRMAQQTIENLERRFAELTMSDEREAR